MRDPDQKLTADQLNGGEFALLEAADWNAIRPFLEENERQFGISINHLLNGQSPADVYRKIQPKTVRALQAEEAWVQEEHYRSAKIKKKTGDLIMAKDQDRRFFCRQITSDQKRACRLYFRLSLNETGV